MPALLLPYGEPADDPAASPYVYGPAYSATAHLANRLAGNDSAGEVSTSNSAYNVRHWVSALIALITSLAVGLCVRVITGSRLIALWTAAALLAIPIWTGMGFMNPKDTAAAAGYTLFTAGMVLALGRREQPKTSRGRGISIAGLLAAGFFLGVGTRLALWLPLTGTFLILMTLYAGRLRFAGWRNDRAFLVAVIGGFLAGIASVIAIYPKVFAGPVEFLVQTLTGSSDFEWTGYTLTAGRLLTENAPWWYLPAWTFASIPHLILLLAVLGAAGFIWSWLRRTGGKSRILRNLLERPDLGLVLVLCQAVPLALGSILISSVMYTGLRQHLYLVPAIAILAGAGVFYVSRRFARWKETWRGTVLALALGAALLIPATEGALLFPYNYAYISPAAGIGGVNDRWETDYWWISSREGVEMVPDGIDPLCSTQLDPEFTDAASVSLRPCSTIGLDYFDRAGDPIGSFSPDDPRVWVIARKRGGGQIPEQCSRGPNVTRWLRGEEVVMSYVLTCDRRPGPAGAWPGYVPVD